MLLLDIVRTRVLVPACVSWRPKWRLEIERLRQRLTFDENAELLSVQRQQRQMY